MEGRRKFKEFEDDGILVGAIEEAKKEGNEPLAKWLDELRESRKTEELLRIRIADLSESLNEQAKEHRKFRRVASMSPNGNIHMRLDISQYSKAWMSVREISEVVAFRSRIDVQEFVTEIANGLVVQAVSEFFAELRRPMGGVT